MKKVLIAAACLVLFACSTPKQIGNIAQATTECTDCTVIVEQNKQLNVLGNSDTGTYYNFSENTNTTVIKYTYETGKDATTVDGGYTETLLFQLPNNITQGEWIDKEIQQLNPVLNVQCYCKGKAGVYPITSGIISLKKNTLTVSIPNLVANQQLLNLSISLK
ncbi:hypothetical protein NBRC110019_24170 [Neptunitalea chrysea]|uniref:Lipoprotein n=1 Tax=Neptunitalea chrysea TaxID=1647581 RepID=A0A9W6EVU6_9FLAO|nr:hypothetical protein [Neptunitalea chrysea]GLB53376.1 hypothetical protein NBRC110019_24170 [Neptunitalea chrysea]